MDNQVIGKVLAIAIRSSEGGPMREITQAAIPDAGGIEGDLPSSPNRALTLLAAGQWRQINAELGTDLPWHTRRANVLIDCDSLVHLIGKTIAIGQVRLEVLKETRPCELMDRQHDGLRRALEPECRGGVHGRILQTGRFCVGDVVAL